MTAEYFLVIETTFHHLGRCYVTGHAGLLLGDFHHRIRIGRKQGNRHRNNNTFETVELPASWPSPAPIDGSSVAAIDYGREAAGSFTLTE